MTAIEFTGQSRRDSDSPQADPSRLINLLREFTAGTQTQAVLKSVLGTEAFAETANVFMRAMRNIGGVVYVAVGGKLYSVTQGATATELGDITDSPDTTIEGNNGSVCIAAGGDYFVWDGSTLTQPTTGAIDDIGSVEFIGQRTILTERNGRKVQWSDVADASTFDALSFATTESSDDNNIRALVINGNLWIYKEEHTEIWALTGGVDVLAPISNTIDVGLKGYRLICKFPDGAFFVGSDGIVYVTTGNGLLPVSTTAVETAIKQGNPTQAFYYEDEGHKIACLRFSDRPAWCYDLSTKEWHERAQGVQHKPWPAVETVKAWGGWYIGTDLGDIYRLTRNNEDATDPLLRRAVSRTLEIGKGRLAKLEVKAEMGVNSLPRDVPVFVTDNGVLLTDENGVLLTSGTVMMEAEPYIRLRMSKDRGMTFGPEKWRGLGIKGDYRNRVEFRSLGQSRQTGCFVAELSASDPVDRPIYATCDVVVA